MSNVALRKKLAEAGRILESEDQGDYCLGHVTLRLDDDPQLFLMKPGAIGLDEMTQENIITIDVEGAKMDGTAPLHNEVYIHTEIMRIRPEITAVVHTHAPYSVAFSSLGKKLLPVGHGGSMFSQGLPVFSETTDLIVNQQLGKAVATCLGPHQAMLLRNHGIVTAGRTIEEAVWLALTLEKSCQLQLLAEAAGGPKLVTSPEEALRKVSNINRSANHTNVWNYILRKLARDRH